jgi:hypothetical protein
MATINCVLREALPYYFWVGFCNRRSIRNDSADLNRYQPNIRV